MALRILFSTILFVLLFSGPAPAFQGLVQSFDGSGGSGTLAWGDGSMSANATVTLPEDPALAEREAPLAVRQAVRKARRTLLQMIMSVHIDARHTVADYMADNTDVAGRIRGLVQSSPIQRPSLSDPVGEVRVFESLRGALAHLLLMPTLQFQSRIPPRLPMAITWEGDGEEGAVDNGPVSRDAVRGYTGLVVDARGLNCIPALAPVIYGQDGNGAYGPYLVSRDDALARGVAAYATTTMNKVLVSRVGRRPLTVRALSVTGPYHTDLIVSTHQAQLIRAMFESGDLARELRVAIVVDEPAPAMPQEEVQQ